MSEYLQALANEKWFYLILIIVFFFVTWLAFLLFYDRRHLLKKKLVSKGLYYPFGGYPFLLSLAPTYLKEEKEKEKTPKKSVFCRIPERYGLYLYPYDLKIWFCLFAAIIAMASIFISSINIKATSYELFFEILYLVFWPSLFLLGYFLGFFILYHKVKLRCLRNVFPELPCRLEEWILGQVERIDILEDDKKDLSESKNYADVRLRNILTPKGKLRTKTHKRYIKRLNIKNLTHPQEWLLRYAITSFFQDSRSYIPSIKLKVLIYWGAPVWIGYFLLIIPLFFLMFNECYVNSPGLFFTLLIWASLSTIFTHIQTKTVAPSVSPKFERNELDYLPIGLQASLNNFNEKAPDRQYYKKMYQKWITIINFFAFTLYILLMNLAVET